MAQISKIVGVLLFCQMLLLQIASGQPTVDSTTEVKDGKDFEDSAKYKTEEGAFDASVGSVVQATHGANESSVSKIVDGNLVEKGQGKSLVPRQDHYASHDLGAFRIREGETPRYSVCSRRSRDFKRLLKCWKDLEKPWGDYGMFLMVKNRPTNSFQFEITFDQLVVQFQRDAGMFDCEHASDFVAYYLWMELRCPHYYETLKRRRQQLGM